MSEISGRSILVVEDHLDTQMLMRQILKKEGHTVEVVGTGAEALKKLETFSPDVILLDLSLPGMSGEEFMKSLRGDARTAGIKVLIISGWDNLKERAEAIGADGCIRKPFQIAQFQKQLEATFSNSLPTSPTF